MIPCRQHGSQSVRQISRLIRPSFSPLGDRHSSTQNRRQDRHWHAEKIIRRAKPNPDASHIVVLGGGITGLASACFLTQEIPNAKITILEKGDRLGGWLKSPIHEVGGPKGGRVVFENGPRTLRQDLWGGHCTRELIEMLDLGKDLVITPKDAPAACNRYLYYPDHLVRMPGPVPGAGLISNVWHNLSGILTEPVFKGLFPGVLTDVFKHRPRPKGISDESLGSFISRKFNPAIANNIASAVMHGIYAGDLYKLSARALLPLFWLVDSLPKAERSILGFQTRMSAVYGMKLHPSRLVNLLLQTWDGNSKFDNYLHGSLSILDNASVFTFRDGLQQLVDGLEAKVKSHPRVTIKLNADVSSIQKMDKEGHVAARTVISGTTSSEKRFKVPADYVVSTLGAPTMARLFNDETSAAFEGYDYAVNVMVVNLFYRSPTLIPVQGFGYLIPRSIPFEENPECALGVIFGSDSSVGQDTAEGTKLTVMMGGHWWDGRPVSELPDSGTAIQMAKNVLARHLGITNEPLISSATLQLSAIPQYTVGHHARLERIHNVLTEGPYQGRIKVAGSWYTGVGVNDCITAAKQAASDIRERNDKASGVGWFANPLWSVERRHKGETHIVNNMTVGYESLAAMLKEK